MYLRSLAFLLIVTILSPELSSAQDLLLSNTPPTVTSENAPPNLEVPASVNQDFMPPPLQGLKLAIPQETTKAPETRAQAAPVAVAGPPVASVVEELPTPKVDLSAIPSFTTVPKAELVRGNEVLTLSNTALRNSGVFQRALNNSPELAQSAEVVQAYQMRVQATRQQLFRERAMQSQLHQEIRSQKQQPPPNGANALNAPNQSATPPQDIPTLQSQAAKQAQRVSDLQAINDQQEAELKTQEVDFERQLWNVGLNGAKIGTVTSNDSSTSKTAADNYDRHIMVKAVSRTSSDNLGYSRTRVYSNGDFGWRTIPSEYLLPLPAQPNNLFYPKNAAGETQRDPDGTVMAITQDDAINPVTQLKAQTQGYYFYDTGFVDRKLPNFAEGVTLGGPHALGAGQSFVSSLDGQPVADFINVNLEANTQILDAGGGNTVQAFAVGNNDYNNNGVDLSSFGLRAYNRDSDSPFQGWSVLVGQKQSIFGDIALTPAGLLNDRNLIGTANRTNNRIDHIDDAGISQLGVTAPLSDFVSLSGAIEDPNPGNEQSDVKYTSRTGITTLNRWPTLTSNLNFHNLDRTNILQLGALTRSNGYEQNLTNEEFFATGWGLSGIAQFLFGDSNMFYTGVAGGDGVGRYIVGIPDSAVADPATNSIESLDGIGTFAGYQHWFRRPCDNKPIAVFNAACGTSYMEDPGIAFATENQKLHQAWVNYTRFIGNRTAVGVEYEYGYREEASGRSGEDHRFMLVLTLITQPLANKTQVRNDAFTAPAIETAVSPIDAPAPHAGDIRDAAGYQTAAATLDGRPLTDVVSQYQRGGAAFQQGL